MTLNEILDMLRGIIYTTGIFHFDPRVVIMWAIASFFIYLAIVKKFEPLLLLLAQFFADFEYDQSIIIINIALDQFKASGNITRVTGWKEIITDNPGNWNNERNSDRNQEQQLPAVTKGESLVCKRLELKEKQYAFQSFYPLQSIYWTESIDNYYWEKP